MSTTDPTQDLPVRLRPLQPQDDSALRVLFDDPATRLWNPGPEPGQPAQKWRADSAATEDSRTWAVVSGETGSILGTVSVFSVDQVTGQGEIGFRTMPSVRGRGVARGAMELACAAAAAELGARRLVLYHAVANVASCRVATACGFLLESLLPANYRYGDGELHDEHLHSRELG